jgi:hypothetical protein
MVKLTGKEIFEKIFAKLEVDNSKTVADLVKETNFKHETVRKNLELIEFIQSQPKLILERTGHSYQAKLEKKP